MAIYYGFLRKMRKSLSLLRTVAAISAGTLGGLALFSCMFGSVIGQMLCEWMYNRMSALNITNNVKYAGIYLPYGLLCVFTAAITVSVYHLLYDRWLRTNAHRCSNCGYCLAELMQLRCPECGQRPYESGRASHKRRQESAGKAGEE